MAEASENRQSTLKALLLPKSGALGALGGFLAALLLFSSSGYRFVVSGSVFGDPIFTPWYVLPGLSLGIVMASACGQLKPGLWRRGLIVLLSILGNASAVILAQRMQATLGTFLLAGAVGTLHLIVALVLSFELRSPSRASGVVFIFGLLSSALFYLLVSGEPFPGWAGIQWWLAYAVWQGLMAGAIGAQGFRQPA